MNGQGYLGPTTAVAHWEDFKVGLRVGVIPCRMYSNSIPKDCVEIKISDLDRCSENSFGTTFVGIDNTLFFITNRPENSNETLKIRFGSGLNPRELNRVISEISRYNPRIRNDVVLVPCPDGDDQVERASENFWKSATGQP